MATIWISLPIPPKKKTEKKTFDSRFFFKISRFIWKHSDTYTSVTRGHFLNNIYVPDRTRIWIVRVRSEPYEYTRTVRPYLVRAGPYGYLDHMGFFQYKHYIINFYWVLQIIFIIIIITLNKTSSHHEK